MTKDDKRQGVEEEDACYVRQNEDVTSMREIATINRTWDDDSVN
jgi:hypothetical protein